MSPVPAFLRPRRGVLPLIALLGAALLGACSDELDARGGCPILCPEAPAGLRDTTLILDDARLTVTPIAGFPARGLEGRLLLAQVTDAAGTLDSRAVIRFDTLVSRFRIGATDTLRQIEALDSARLTVRVDSIGTRATGPVTLEVYDLDRAGETGDDAAALAALFVPERLIGSRTLPVDSLRDTVSIPIASAPLQDRLTNRPRIRVGLRATSGGDVAVRLLSTNGGYIHSLSYKPSNDSGVTRIINTPTSRDPASIPSVRSALADYNLLVSAGEPALGDEIRVGGPSGFRTLLRFDLPAALIDSVSVVNAVLELRQLPLGGFRGADSVTVFPFIPVGSDVVADPVRLAELFAPWGRDLAALYGPFSFTTSLAVLPSESGVVRFQIGGLVRAWQSAGVNLPRALLLVGAEEGSAPGLARFDASAAPAVAPRLVITYAPPPGQGLP